MTEGLQRLGVDVPSLVAYLVNFGLLLVLLNFVAYRPALAALERRRAAAREAARAIEEGRRDIDAQRKLTERLREAVRRRAQADLVQARAAARAEIHSARLQAERVAREYIARARRTVANERRQASSELKREAAAMVARATEAALGRLLTEPERVRLVAEATGEITRMTPVPAAGRRHGLTRAVTARRLSEREGLALVAALTKMAGRPQSLVESVDPAVLGGVLLRLGDVEVDATVRGRLDRLARDMAGEANPGPTEG